MKKCGPEEMCKSCKHYQFCLEEERGHQMKVEQCAQCNPMDYILDVNKVDDLHNFVDYCSECEKGLGRSHRGNALFGHYKSRLLKLAKAEGHKLPPWLQFEQETGKAYHRAWT